MTIGASVRGAPYHAEMVAPDLLENVTVVASRAAGGGPTGTFTDALKAEPMSQTALTALTAAKTLAIQTYATRLRIEDSRPATRHLTDRAFSVRRRLPAGADTPRHFVLYLSSVTAVP